MIKPELVIPLSTPAYSGLRSKWLHPYAAPNIHFRWYQNHSTHLHCFWLKLLWWEVQYSSKCHQQNTKSAVLHLFTVNTITFIVLTGCQQWKGTHDLPHNCGAATVCCEVSISIIKHILLIIASATTPASTATTQESRYGNTASMPFIVSNSYFNCSSPAFCIE